MEHFYQHVPGWFNYPDMFSYAVRHAPSTAHFVEIGTWKGQSSAFLAVEIINSGKAITLDCIDSFEGSPIEPGQMHDPSILRGTLYEEFLLNMKPVAGHFTPIRSDSVAAAARYADESLDFVFIDGSHDFDSIFNDITAWYPKVKVGGLFGGHDYAHPYPGIRYAVDHMLAKEAVHIFPSTCWYTTKIQQRVETGFAPYQSPVPMFEYRV